MKRIQHTFYYIALTVASIVLWCFLGIYGLLDGLEQEAMRWRYLVRGERTSSASIVYVDLDAPSVASIGARPWDRRNFAEVIRALIGLGQAKVVGVDIIFSQLGRGSLLDVSRVRSGDLALGQAVHAYQDRVVLASAYTGATGGAVMIPLIRNGFDNPRENAFPESPSYPIIDWQVGRLGLANVDEALGKGVIPYWVVGFVAVEGEQYSQVLMTGMRSHLYEVLNAPKIVAGADTLLLTDADGWTPHEIPRESQQVLYSLGLEVFLAAHGLTDAAVEHEADRLLIRKEGAVFREVPLVGQQSIEVNWFEGWDVQNGQTEHVSFRDVRLHKELLGQAQRAGDREAMAAELEWFARFKDKVIFLGPVDPQLKDVAPTPYNREPVPKVGLHANLYRTLQGEVYMTRASPVQSIGLIVGLTVLVTLMALWSGVGRAATRIGSVVVVLSYVLLVFWAFASWHWVLPLIAPVGASVCAALGVTLLKLGAEEWARRRIKTLFGAYVSPDLVDQMVEAQRDPELGGAEAEITALFSDVEGFSALSELLHPDELVALMNEYLSAMTDALQAEGGTLDKYVGDAIVTMFGMPLPQIDHAARACVAALRMQERHALLRDEWRASGKWPEAIFNMRTRIGLNSGLAVIGNMGSRMRFTYTMMGDSVNLAARCESGAKSYGVYTMITDATLQAVVDVLPELQYRKLDRIIVKGRSQSVEIYELWDSSINMDEASLCRQEYEAGLAHYFRGEWSMALGHLEQSARVEPSRTFAPTTPSAVIAGRCRQFMQEGSPANWNGVFQMQTK